MLPTIEWQDDAVVMVDQRKLPTQESYIRCKTAKEVARAIKKMVIRGAPAIGVVSRPQPERVGEDAGAGRLGGEALRE